MKLVEPIRDRKKIEAMKHYLQKRSPRDYTLFCLGINSGLRVSDLLALKVSDVVTVQNGQPMIKPRIEIKEKKTGKVKDFPLNPRTYQLLNDYAVNMYSHRWLFSSRLGNYPIDRVQAWRIISAAARAVGIADRIGTHTLRKTFGYWAFKLGHDITVIQKLLNHSSPGTTLAYIGITKEDLDDVYLSLNL